MDIGLVVLRLLHIGSGVFWAGSAMFVFFFLEPATRALGPQAGPVMDFIVSRKRLPQIISAAATVNVVAGTLLYWRVSNGFDTAWVSSPTGIGLTIGGLAAIGSWAMGLTAIAPTIERLNAIGGEVARAGGPPAPALLAEMERLGAKLHRVTLVSMVLIFIAVLLMAISRYLVR